MWRTIILRVLNVYDTLKDRSPTLLKHKIVKRFFTRRRQRSNTNRFLSKYPILILNTWYSIHLKNCNGSLHPIFVLNIKIKIKIEMFNKIMSLFHKRTSETHGKMLKSCSLNVTFKLLFLKEYSQMPSLVVCDKLISFY